MRKKILITKDIHSLIDKEESFLKRKDITVYTPVTKEEALDIHRSEKMDIILIDLYSPEMSSEEFCTIIRDDVELRNVSIIIISPDDESSVEISSRCRANDIITKPLQPALFFHKAQRFLNISVRSDFRTSLGIKIHTDHESKPFVSFSQNISSSGILFEADRQLNIGDKITCGFYLPDSTHIVSEAQVMRIEKKHNEAGVYKYGIRFTDLKPEFKEVLESFIKDQNP